LIRLAGSRLLVQQNGRVITVSLACIDSPEMAQQPHGQRARDYLPMQLQLGSNVRLDVNTTDRFGRIVAEVIGDINIGLALVEDGQAFAYRQHLRGCNAREYLDAEFRASRQRHGVWQVPGGITDGTAPGGRRYRCREISSYSRAQQLLRQGHTDLDGDGDE
jgi:endonuclease YncB( thermonuclease family)